MRRRILLPVTVLVAAGLVALPLSGARAATATAATAATATLPLTSYYQMAVDSIHGHLFFSQGSSSKNSILVTNFSGGTVATITGQTGVMGITLSPDGSTLYAALAGAGEVTAISTATLQQVAVYPLGAGDTPRSVAVQTGKLWVSYDNGTLGSSTIGDFDLSAANPVLEPQAAMGGWYSAPMIAADPSDAGNVLVALEPGESPAAVASYDTSQDPVTVRAKAAELVYGDGDNCDNAADLAVVPGGGQFIPACGYPYAHYRYSTATLSQQGSYASTNYPDAIAIASGTGTVAAGVNNSYATDDIYVYAPGGDTPLSSFNAGSGQLVDRGLGLTTDASELFAVTNDSNSFILNTYTDPALQQSSLTLAGAATAGIGHAVTLDGTLTAGAAALAGAKITVTRTGPGGTKTLTATTNSDGTFTLTDTPPATGSYTYTASFAGTATVAPAAVTHRVTVSLLSASLTLSATPRTANYDAAVRVTAHLGATYTNRTVEIFAKAAGVSASTRLADAKVNSSGNITVSSRVTRTTTFTAVFPGDARYAEKSAAITVDTRARVAVAISDYYASKRVGSVTYRLFHHTKHLNVAALVAPNKAGECAQVEIQEYYRGGWKPNVRTNCFSLSKSSGIAVYFTLGQADIGYPYRVRSDYVRGSDTRNLSADSGWLYFMVEK